MSSRNMAQGAGGMADEGSGGMPALPAAIAGVATLGGALIGSRSQNRATESQQQSNREAIQLERERMAQEQAAWEAEQVRREPYRRAAASVLARYGISIPDVAPAGAAPGAAAMPGAPAGAGMASPPPMGSPGRGAWQDAARMAAVGQRMRPRVAAAPGIQPRQFTLGDIASGRWGM